MECSSWSGGGCWIREKCCSCQCHDGGDGVELSSHTSSQCSQEENYVPVWADWENHHKVRFPSRSVAEAELPQITDALLRGLEPMAASPSMLHLNQPGRGRSRTYGSVTCFVDRILISPSSPRGQKKPNLFPMFPSGPRSLSASSSSSPPHPPPSPLPTGVEGSHAHSRVHSQFTPSSHTVPGKLLPQAQKSHHTHPSWGDW
ncbi:unnamed protein product [Pleuronectes platessa]|uniref:Uncharacterized protein n=1 Tax=Pleuronectes platessa TaxID=8262 RepID=A0A9N7UDS2_PLEPL|nr:unnamed protein product [Pleuronectes platessa]